MTTPGTSMTDAHTAHDAVTIGLVSISDRASAGVYEDKGIPALRVALFLGGQVLFDVGPRACRFVVERLLCF